MRGFVFAALLGVISAPAMVLAQAASEAPQPGAAAPAQPVAPAPAQPAAAPPPQVLPPGQPGSAGANARGPANICQELVAYVRQQAAQPGSAPKEASAGQNATAVQGTSTQGAPTPQASGQGSNQSSGMSAPIAKSTENATPATATISLDTAEGYARDNNLLACRDATQRMRRAGVALPTGLLALAALKPELLQAGAQR